MCSDRMCSLKRNHVCSHLTLTQYNNWGGRGGLFTKLYYSALVESDIMRRLYTWGITQHYGTFLPLCYGGRLSLVSMGPPEFPVTTSYSNSRGHCSTDTGHCLRWKGSPASSHSQNPPSKRREKEPEQKRWNICWHFCTLKMNGSTVVLYNKLTESVFMVSIRRRTCSGIALYHIRDFNSFQVQTMLKTQQNPTWQPSQLTIF